ncbi:MAG: hypothetical protein R3C02_23815 [Planctomycetaceae bacterium]
MLRQTITHLTVDQLRVAFQAYCDGYYVFPIGQQTGEADNIRDAIRYLDPWQDEPVAGFGPRKLETVRDDMIAAGTTRRSINKRMKRTADRASGSTLEPEQERTPSVYMTNWQISSSCISWTYAPRFWMSLKEYTRELRVKCDSGSC